MQLFGLILALVAIFSAVTTAVPIEDDAVSSTVPFYQDKFDDRQTKVEPVGISNEIGNYGALFYKGLSIANSTRQVISVKPPTLPNYIFARLSTDTTAIQFLPANKSTTRFHLRALDYACVLDVVGTGQACTIQVAGRKAAGYGGTTAVKELVYDPSKANGKYDFVTFDKDDFINLDQVSISSKVPGLTLVLFDSVFYQIN